MLPLIATKQQETHIKFAWLVFGVWVAAFKIIPLRHHGHQILWNTWAISSVNIYGSIQECYTYKLPRSHNMQKKEKIKFSNIYTYIKHFHPEYTKNCMYIIFPPFTAISIFTVGVLQWYLESLEF